MEIHRVFPRDKAVSCYILDGDAAPQCVGIVECGDHKHIDTRHPRLPCDRAVVLRYGVTEEMGILKDECLWEDGSISYTFHPILQYRPCSGEHL